MSDYILFKEILISLPADEILIKKIIFHVCFVEWQVYNEQNIFYCLTYSEQA